MSSITLVVRKVLLALPTYVPDPVPDTGEQRVVR